MPLKAVANGAEKAAERMEVTVGNAQKRVVRVEAWNGSAWKVAQSFAPPITLNVAPFSVSGTGDSNGTIQITSGIATATPTGGTAPYTYAWTKVSGDTMTVTNSTSASTAFRASVGPGDSRSATYRCTVTDKNGLSAQDTVSITLTNTSGA